MKHSAAGTAGLGETAAQLRKRHGEIWDPDVGYAEQEHSDLALRTDRAISWLEGAACEHRPGEASGGDPDAAFIFLWIAFNAAYAAEIETDRKLARERKLFGDYFKKLHKLDEDNAIYDAIWSKFSGPVRLLLDNKYLYGPYWKKVAGKPGGKNWEEGFSKSKKKAYSALSKGNANVVLEVLFDRLYVLRNQLLHGGAKWGSTLNRENVCDGVNILSHLVPIFVELMLKKPGDTKWGKLEYPPLNRR